jgi:hypothetical protein
MGASTGMQIPQCPRRMGPPQSCWSLAVGPIAPAGVCEGGSHAGHSTHKELLRAQHAARRRAVARLGARLRDAHARCGQARAAAGKQRRGRAAEPCAHGKRRIARPGRQRAGGRGGRRGAAASHTEAHVREHGVQRSAKGGGGGGRQLGRRLGVRRGSVVRGGGKGGGGCGSGDVAGGPWGALRRGCKRGCGGARMSHARIQSDTHARMSHGMRARMGA